MNKTIIGILAAVAVIGAGWLLISHSSNSDSTESSVPVATTPNEYHDNIYLIKPNPVGGTYLTDFAGVTLYTFDNDTSGVSNCSGKCATIWPPYISGAAAEGTLPAHITVVTRADGSKQYAWNGSPLYYYSVDKAPGDMIGNDIDGMWHIVKF